MGLLAVVVLYWLVEAGIQQEQPAVAVCTYLQNLMYVGRTLSSVCTQYCILARNVVLWFASISVACLHSMRASLLACDRPTMKHAADPT
jgi:hypothetical protein